MKKLIALSALAILSAACGPAANETARNAAPAPSPAATTSKPVMTDPQPATPAGQPVTQEVEVKFAEKLPDGWTFTDPKKDGPASEMKIANGRLVLPIPSGRDLYADNLTAPRVTKAIKGDFQIDTRVKFSPKQDYQGAGLVVFGGKDRYLRLERAFGGTGGGEGGIRLDVRMEDKYEPLSTPQDIATEADEVELRLIRKGKQFSAYWRLNEEAEWREVGQVELAYGESVEVGLLGCNTGDDIVAEFSFIKLAPVKSA